MQRNALLLTLIFAIFTQILPAQECPNFARLMQSADDFWKKGEFEKALNQLSAAREHCPQRGDEVNKKTLAFTTDITRKYREAEAERKRANRKTREAEAAKETAEAAEKKATAVLDKIYFYNDRFGLAFDKSNGKYGFIDKNLTTKVRFKYKEALPFEETGFAKVKGYYDNKLRDFFIDTLGTEYLLATDLNQLSPEITALDLRQKGLVEIPDTVLKSTQLKILLLNSNELQTIPIQIGELKNLQSLDLSYNQLQVLPAQIGKLQDLRSLDIHLNELQRLPVQIGELENLQSLDVSINTSLQNLPVQIGELQNLQSLNLNYNNLQRFPIQIIKLKNLQSLNLSNNQLDSLPVQISELKNLQSLNLSSNKLQTLPAHISELSLQSLDLSFNNLEDIPTQISEMKYLQVLNLEHNNLQSLTSQIGELKNLQLLNLSSNQLQSLPARIGELKNLQSLDLSFNHIEGLPTQISELKHLQSLDLKWNNLQGLPAQIGGLKNLQSLDLSSNYLQSLPNQVNKLHNLKSLDLEHNHLQNLPAQIDRLPNLQSLKLINNNFRTLPIAEFGKMSNLTYILLGDQDRSNPLLENYVDTLRMVMFWCWIEFEPTAFFEKNRQVRDDYEIEASEGELRLEDAPDDTAFQKELAGIYRELGKYQLLTSQFSAAEISVNRGLVLDSTNIDLPIYRSFCLLLQGKTAPAMEFYKKYQNLQYSPGTPPFFYWDAFWWILSDLESAGAIPEARLADVEAVRRLLGVKKE